MGLLQFPIFAVLMLSRTAIEVFTFFVVVRGVAMRWPTPWLKSIDAAGKPMVDGWLSWVDARMARSGRASVSPELAILCSLLLAWLAYGVVVSMQWVALGGAVR